MKQVKFTTTMAPHGIGDTRVVPDEVADKLISEGHAEAVESVFDQQKKAGKKRYFTRGSNQ